MSVDNIFSTPIYQTELKKFQGLEEYALHLSETTESVYHSNHGGFHSEIFKEPKKPFAELWEAISDECRKFHYALGLNGQVELTNFWFNINWTSNSTTPHDHPYSVLSGVFYVKAHEKCGDLTFHNHNRLVEWCFPPPTIEQRNATNSSNISFTPETNMLYVFPSWVLHSVASNMSDKPRISVSFNTGVLFDSDT